MKDNYMLASTLLLALSFIPFVWSYERQKPKARKLVTIAVMCALTVVSNLICAYTVPLHAGTAMVILTGVALGAQAGLLTGAMSRFVCNFFMGQGTWTMWEMLAWGLLGALAGILFCKVEMLGHLDDKKYEYQRQTIGAVHAVMQPLLCMLGAEAAGYVVCLITEESGRAFLGYPIYLWGVAGIAAALLVRRKKLPVNVVTLSLFTFVCVFLIYGGIMNLAAFFMTGSVRSRGLEGLKILYVTGVGYDALHALGAAACVFVFGDGIVRKLERIKLKYGM